LRRTVLREGLEDEGERTAEKRVLEALRGLTESAFGARTNIFATGGFTELRGEGMPGESCETVQQRWSGVGRIEQLENGEGWVTGVCGFLPGQQRWRVREGSVEAGEAPACTTAAARGRMPEHALAGWLTDHPSSVTIKTTPRDRLAITGKIMGRESRAGCDPGHVGMCCGYQVLVPGRVASFL
jgi:hypothetical protein